VSPVIARAILSVCLSVTVRCFAQTNEGTIVQFSASGQKNNFSFWRGKVCPDIRRGSPLVKALK